ncbi:MAG: 23S rRNA (adenine(2503)-C(2))-methyltransferase RlmN [Candidatus Omnitrophota bacterium]|nr:23S rRNA (adenine(2503)-C(2))-methyltransferase RlmN [Candidatus Omnitrophota bacterium]
MLQCTRLKMQSIKGLNLEELENILKAWNEPSFHARQIFSWIYKKGAVDFSMMSDLPFVLREQLKKDFCFSDLKPVKVFKSKDGTKKLLLALKDKNFIEAVSIPAKNRLTGCISTQVGCRFSCKFCASARLGFRRNLSTQEMIDEILCLKNNSLDRKLTHFVFMGIGEPLDNYDNVIKTIRIVNSAESLNIGSRRITISSCGLIPQMKRLSGEGLQIELSISLHAADNKTRSGLMPVNKIYPLEDLLCACKEYIVKTRRQITFEYVLIKGVNSKIQDALNLARILKGLKLCKINLIPANSIAELHIEPAGKLETLLFRDCLLKKGMNVTLRKPCGRDIEASCGQLQLRYHCCPN